MKNHIAIVGAGNGGQAFAGYLSLMGERIKIFDVVPATVEKLNEVGGVLMEGNSKLTGFGKIEKATTRKQEVIEAVRPAAIAASMQKDVVSEVAKSFRIPQTMRDSIATAAKMSRLMNISGIVNLEDKGNKTEDNDLENNRD